MAYRKVILFHVGTVKTGSTAIQKYLWDNREALLSQGVEYLQVTPPRLDLPRYANADFLFDEATDFDRVVKLIESSTADQIVISEEGLWGRPHVMLHPAFDQYDKKIVLYLRNSADLIASWAAEHAEPYHAAVKPPPDLPAEYASGPLPIEIGLRQCRHFYRRIFEGFLGFLELFVAVKGEVVIRPFERNQLVGHDVVADFLNLLGPNVDLPASSSQNVTINPSRDREFCDVSTLTWEFVKARGVENAYALPLVERVHAACLSGDRRPVVETVSDEWIAEVTDEFAFVERDLARRFMGGQDILKQKMPRIFGKPRAAYQPIDQREVELLFELETTRQLLGKMTTAFENLAKSGSVRPSKNGTALEAALLDVTAQLDSTLVELDQARRERDRAKRYPWKYVRHAMALRYGRKA